LVSLLARAPHLLDPAVSYAVEQEHARGFFILLASYVLSASSPS